MLLGAMRWLFDAPRTCKAGYCVITKAQKVDHKKKPEYLPKKSGRFVTRKLSHREASRAPPSGRVGFRLAFKMQFSRLCPV